MPAYYVKAAVRSVRADSGALIVNTIHYEVDQLSSPADYGAMSSDLWTAWGTQYLNILASVDTCLELTVTQSEQAGVAPGQGVHQVNAAGTRSLVDLELSQALCALISLKTNTPKRYGRGRVFCPPAYSSSAIAPGGQWDLADPYWAAIAAWANVALKPFTHGSTGYVPIIYSRTQFDRGATPYTFPITAFLTQTQQHFLRSRLSSP